MKIQLFFFLGVCAITLHFSIRLGIESYPCFSYDKGGRARISQWEIVEIKKKFGLKADYAFLAQEKNWSGSFTLSPPYYLNEGAALSALKEKAKMEWTAWYNPKNPQVSALEKSFPTGLFIRTLICYGVLVYFLFLKRRMLVIETS